jgi:TolA-binding protein
VPGERARDHGAELARARALLARGDTAAAARTARGVLADAPARALAAEAGTVLAECALVAGRSDEAIELYLAVAREHGELPAGENAAFAAARAATRAGRTARADELLRAYVARYPAGRFRDEALRRLGEEDVAP